MISLDDTLKLWRQGQFIYGQSDCLLSVGDYMAANGGLDVAGRLRGTYDDREGAEALIDAHGGMLPLVDLAGWPRVPSPGSPGAVVVVRIGRRLFGALRTEKGVAARMKHGVLELDLKLVHIEAAWHV